MGHHLVSFWILPILNEPTATQRCLTAWSKSMDAINPLGSWRETCRVRVVRKASVEPWLLPVKSGDIYGCFMGKYWE